MLLIGKEGEPDSSSIARERCRSSAASFVDGVVCRDAARLRGAASWAREREVRSPKQISSWRAPRAPPRLPEAARDFPSPRRPGGPRLGRWLATTMTGTRPNGRWAPRRQPSVPRRPRNQLSRESHRSVAKHSQFCCKRRGFAYGGPLNSAYCEVYRAGRGETTSPLSRRAYVVSLLSHAFTGNPFLQHATRGVF